MSVPIFFNPISIILPTYDIITQDYISLGEICQDSNLFFWVFCIFCVISGCDKIGTTELVRSQTMRAEQPLTVMTYNAYINSSIDNALGATNILQLPTEIATVYNDVKLFNSDF